MRFVIAVAGLLAGILAARPAAAQRRLAPPRLEAPRATALGAAGLAMSAPLRFRAPWERPPAERVSPAAVPRPGAGACRMPVGGQALPPAGDPMPVARPDSTAAFRLRVLPAPACGAPAT